MAALLQWKMRSLAWALRFDPRARYLVSAHADGLSVWLVASGERVRGIQADLRFRSPGGSGHVYPGADRGPRTRIGFSGGNVLASLRHGEIGIWNLESDSKVDFLTNEILLDVSGDGRRALTCSPDAGSLPRVWDLQTREPFVELPSRDARHGVSVGALSADGRVALVARGPSERSAGANGTLEAWDLAQGARIRDDMFEAFRWSETGPVELSPSGTSGLALLYNANAAVWFPLDDRELPGGGCDQDNRCGVFLDERRFVTYVQQGIELWTWREEDWTHPQPYHQIKPGVGANGQPSIAAIAVSPDTRTLAIADDRLGLSLWDISQDPSSAASREFPYAHRRWHRPLERP